MKPDQAIPGARIIEHHPAATPKTIISHENDGFGKAIYVVENDRGRRTRIKAKNLGRYDLIPQDAQTTKLTFPVTDKAVIIEALRRSARERMDFIETIGRDSTERFKEGMLAAAQTENRIADELEAQ